MICYENIVNVAHIKKKKTPQSVIKISQFGEHKWFGHTHNQ